MKNCKSSFIKDQESFYRTDIKNLNRIASPGNQYIIQLIKGGYLSDLYSCNGKKALDIGCGAGYNLISLALMGFTPYGCEISEDIVKYAMENVRNWGVNAEISVGESKSIPFPSSFFDFIISTNVIHYVDSEDGMHSNLKEYARVLKKKGRFLLLTAHPKTWLLKNCIRLDKSLARLNNPDDFRHGETFYIFQNRNMVKTILSKYFSDVEVGVNHLDFFKKEVVNYVVTGIKA